MRLVVYTTLLGPGWKLYDPEAIEKGVRYIAFTDQPDITSSVWDVRRIATDGDPRIQSRHIKTLPWLLFPDSEVSLWIDSKFQLLHAEPSTLAAYWLETWDMVALRHPDRDNIHDEAHVIAQMGLMPRDRVFAQADRYANEGFSQRAITSTGFCLRRHSGTVRHFGELWWNEIRHRGLRDQMSVDYCAWLAGLKVGYLPGHYRDNPYAKWTKSAS